MAIGKGVRKLSKLLLRKGLWPFLHYTIWLESGTERAHRSVCLMHSYEPVLELLIKKSQIMVTYST